MLLNVCYFFLVFFSFLFWRKRPRRFPPGPFSWPVVGNLFQVGLEPYLTVMSLRKKYGDIIGIDIGLKRTVFLNDYKLVKEAFSMSDFSGRVEMMHLADPSTGALRGIITTSKETWKEQRRFTAGYIQAAMRNNAPVETILLNEAKKLICKLTSILERQSQLQIILNSHATQGILVFYPTIAKMMPHLSGFNKIMANIIPLYHFAQEVIDSHKQSFQHGHERDFVDCYLQKIRNTTDKESSFYGDTGNDNLRHTLVHLFVAGSDTGAATLRWMTFLLAHHQNVQEKLYDSLVNFITTTQQNEIRLSDRPMLPFVDAVILEVLRFSSLVPLGVYHETISDVEFHGYKIPKGTVVIANQYGIHHDPDVWGDPENFRPERFLEENETEVIKSAALIPFTTGRRICPGESLARDELFIFSVNLLLSFKIDFDPLEAIPPLAYKYGSILDTIKHKMFSRSVCDFNKVNTVILNISPKSFPYILPLL